MRTIKALVLSLPALAMVGGQIGIGVAATSLFSAPAYAAEKKQVSAKVGKPLKEAQELAKANKFKDAMAKVQEAQAISGKTPFEEHTVNEFQAFIALKLGDYAAAAKAYEATLDSGQLSAQDKQQRMDQLVKMYYQAKNYPKAIQLGNRYLKDVGPNVDIALLIAQAYYIQKDYNNTIDAAQNLIRVANQAGQPVKEDWLKLLMSAQYNLNKDSDRVATLEQLLVRFPSQAYWQDMLAYEMSRSSLSDRQNLEFFRLKEATGTLKNSDYIEMAQLAMALGLPGDAKSILDKGFAAKVLGDGKNKDRENRLLNLAQTQSAADQKSLPQLDKEAQAAANGEAAVRLAEAYASYGDLEKAIATYKVGFDKGNLKSGDEARLHYGIALYQSKRMNDAVQQFKQVPADSKYARIAKLWAVHAQSKG